MRTNRKTIDALGDVREKIAELQETEKKLKDEVAKLGPGTHEGESYYATVTESQRKNLDMEAVREKLSKKFIEEHTTITRYVTVRTNARKEDAA